MLLPGYNAVYRLCWPYHKLPPIADEHCAAKWIDKRPIISTPEESHLDTKQKIDTPKRVVEKLKTRRNPA